MQKLEQVYEGKAKKVFKTDDPELYIVDYKDDATAFNGLKKGTIVGKGVINNQMTNRLMARMEKAGVPTHFVKELSERETLVKKVSIVPLEVIIRIARLCTADEKPAIYCEDVIEKAIAKGNYTLKDLKLPIFHFLQQFCGVNAYMDLTDVRPAVADAALGEILQVPIGTPLLNMDEVDFDIDGKPVFCSQEYFVDGIFRHTVMRKKL